jgi:exosortase C (VPDSG-CTERM-specific)
LTLPAAIADKRSAGLLCSVPGHQNGTISAPVPGAVPVPRKVADRQARQIRNPQSAIRNLKSPVPSMPPVDQHPAAETSAPVSGRSTAAQRLRLAFLALTALTALPLYDLLRLALGSELHSHVLLIPLVSWYLWRFVDQPFSGPSHPSGPMALLVGVLGIGFTAAFVFARYLRGGAAEDTLWLGILGYLFFLLSAFLWLRGWNALCPHLFAAGFLLFFVPLPPIVTDTFSRVLQVASAEVSDWALRAVGLPVLRTDMIFQMPGLTIRVAEECSGVRSTLVLFITSLLAGRLFLRAGWKRALLALATIPLGILRNTLRITAISWLSVNVDPGIIHGPLHHRGGPVFFVLSLVPLFGLLWWLRRTEKVRETDRAA